MYMQHELREVAEQRQTEALARIHYLHGLMSSQPGFILSVACRYLGRTDQYGWFRLWDSAAAQTAYRQTQASKDFAASRPEGFLYGQLPGGIAPGLNWESVIDHPIPTSGNFLVRTVFKVEAGQEAAFVEQRKRYDDLAMQSSGMNTLVTFRSTDADSEGLYLTLTRGDSREAYNAFLEGPLAAKYRDSLPEGIYETLTHECYDVLEELRA
jgi:heme-degrading monooxygenase HmoA